MIVPTGHLNFLYCQNFSDQTVEHDILFSNSAAGLSPQNGKFRVFKQKQGKIFRNTDISKDIFIILGGGIVQI